MLAMFDPPLPCTVADEDVFGPFVNASCHNGFDFTLRFEETILTILPLSILLLSGVLRIRSLSCASDKVNRSWLYAAKEV
jgi:hypothetical protein